MLYTNGAYNNAAGTRTAFGAFSAQLVAEGFPEPRSISGDREHADQVQIFTDRYDQRATGTGLFRDVRYWDGTRYGYPGGSRWVRVSPAGPVAVPGTGNHEARRSNDLAYPYNNANTAAHKRAQQIAPNHGITCEGMSFGEAWHWTFWGSLGVIGAPAVENAKPFPQPPESQEENDMKIIGGPDGAQKFVDEFGADDIGDFFFVDGNFTWVENIHASWKATGVDHTKGQTPEDAANWKEFELIRHIADARWNKKRAQIVADTVTALLPVLQLLTPTIDDSVVEEAIMKAVAALTVTSSVSEKDKAEIAAATVDLLKDRL